MSIVIELTGVAVLCTVVGVGTYKILEWVRKINAEAQKEFDNESE